MPNSENQQIDIGVSIKGNWRRSLGSVHVLLRFWVDTKTSDREVNAADGFSRPVLVLGNDRDRVDDHWFRTLHHRDDGTHPRFDDGFRTHRRQDRDMRCIESRGRHGWRLAQGLCELLVGRCRAPFCGKFRGVTDGLVVSHRKRSDVT
jgi:hypothetical protein